MNKIKKVLTPSGKCIIIQAEVVQCRQCHKILGFWFGKYAEQSMKSSKNRIVSAGIEAP